MKITTDKQTRQFKNPSALTPYEEQLLALKNEGLTYQQMADRLEGKAGRKAIASRFYIINEKLRLKEIST